IAAVDVVTGHVQRALAGKGLGLGIIHHHPDSGFRLTGTRLPQWDDIMSLLKRAAECFPGFRWQHWDVGITDRGPTLYELNSAGNTDIAQIAYGKGIYDDELRDFLRRHGGGRPEAGKVFPET